MSPLKNEALTLAQHRNAIIVTVKGADELFGDLVEKVETLEDLSLAGTPISPFMAAASVKRYIVDPAARIRLHDLVQTETEKLFSAITGPAFRVPGVYVHEAEINARLRKYENLTEVLLAMVIAGCYWSDAPTDSRNWVASLQRIGNSQQMNTNLNVLLKLQKYPALLLLYGAGIAATAGNNYATLAAVLTMPSIRTLSHEAPMPMCAIIHAEEVRALGRSSDAPLPQAPFSDHLCTVLRESFRPYLPADADYQAAFDRFEYLSGLVHADIKERQNGDQQFAGEPVGCFNWRGNASPSVDAEFRATGRGWPPLLAGLFGGDLARARTVMDEWNKRLQTIRTGRAGIR
jgi:hypothetical protein